MSEVKSTAKAKTWIDNLNNGNIKNKTQSVLNYIDKNPNIDLNELRNISKIAHQTVTAIVSGLMDEGVVKITGEKKIGNNTYSQFVVVRDEKEWLRLKLLRRELKMLEWIDEGLKKYADKTPNDLKQKLLEFKNYLEHGDNPYLRMSPTGGINFPD